VIGLDAIAAWGVNHPWPTQEQVEQDLLLSRAICAIAAHPYLGDELVFRGGTALHKLHLDAPWRYSEDLDYVRSTGGGIGPLLDGLREVGADLGFNLNPGGPASQGHLEGCRAERGADAPQGRGQHA
jgi:hypothetical protein